MTERKRLTKMVLPIGVYSQSGDAKATLGPPRKVGSGARPAKTATKGSSSRTKSRD